jgi:hypothetical protein
LLMAPLTMSCATSSTCTENLNLKKKRHFYIPDSLSKYS